MTDSSLVLLERYYDSFTANAAKSYLESHDIPAFLFDEYIDHLWIYQVAAGGLRLMVMPKDYIEAKDLLSTLPAPEKNEPKSFLPRKNIFKACLSIAVLFLIDIPLLFKESSKIDNEND